MSIEQPRGTSPMSDPNDLITNSNVLIYFNNESESIESITIESEENDEINLFPMTLESGEEYMPNLDEYYWDRTLENVNESHFIFSLSLREMENNIFFPSILDDFNRSFLQFARYNLPLKDYARFIIEQEGVNQHFLEADRKGEIPNEILQRDYNELIMYWPEYYPGKKQYDLEFLPTTKELYPLYLFNKLGYILNHRFKYDLRKKSFDYKDLQYLKSFINDNYENESSEIFNKIRDQHNVDSRGISHMMQYIEKWQEILMDQYKKENLLEELNDIPRWRGQSMDYVL